jgi:cephalosporin-C deacetylase-like acetyl esterase
MVCDGFTYGENALRLARLFQLLAALTLPGGLFVCDSAAQNAPPADAFQVLRQVPAGPRITPYLQYQLDQAWRQDEARQRDWEAIQSEQDLLKMQASVRQALLQMIGGLPGQKTKLNPRTTGKIQMDGYSIEKLIFESLPGVFVTALVYVPDDHSQKHPAVLVPAGHATNGKIHYQALCQRLAARGYVVIAWDPVGQGERSQFWDAKADKSRYNLVCAEHAVLGNLAYLAGANLARWEIWDGMRAVDYLLTRPEVDGERINITGTSGGGTQAALIAALDPRIKVAVPSCYISSLPMRMGNRIFVDPDSDPEQDLFRMSSNGVGHPGLLLLMYPRPVMVASAVLDFFPIEGARKSFREAQRLYERFGNANRIAMTEGYHPHQYSDENQEAALDFLDRFNGMPRRRGLAEPKLLPDKDLVCTRSGQVMVDQSDSRTLAEVIREYYQERKSQPAVRLSKEYYEGRAMHVENSKLEKFNGVPPGEDQILWELISSSNAGDVQIDKYVLHHSRLLEMPLLFIHKISNEPQKTVLWFDETGKATRANWPELEKFLQSGYNVVTFDFRGLGETRMPYTAVSPDDPSLRKLDFDRAYANSISGVLANYVYNSLLTGRPYFFQMLEDSQIASRFATEKLGAKSIAVTASGDAYTLASAIAEIFPEIKLFPQPNATALKWSEIVERKQETWPIQYLVPGGAHIH